MPRRLAPRRLPLTKPEGPKDTWPTRNGRIVEVFPTRPAPGNPIRYAWRVKVAANGEVVGGGEQPYKSRRAARRAANREWPEAAS